MAIFKFLYRIARRAGHQGARCSAGNQADSEKFTTGRTKPSPVLFRFFSCFCLAWFIAKFLFSPTQLVTLDRHQQNQSWLLCLVLPVQHFEPTPSYSSWSLYYFHFCQPRYAVSKHISSLDFLKTLLILLAGDVARNPGPINVCFCNMRSLRNKSAIIQDTVNCYSPHIFGISETFLSSSEPHSGSWQNQKNKNYTIIFIQIINEVIMYFGKS